jgi:hypothetical protein
MSWSIPTRIEEDFISGKAQYRTFQTGVGGQSILPVPTNAYAVVFGYDFSPAGGGFIQNLIRCLIYVQFNALIRFFETQQISFYTGTDFYPFIHHVDCRTQALISNIQNNVPPASNTVESNQIYEEIDNTPISRQVYITSDKDITISVGLILDSPVASANAIPQTNRTPALLTYGGSPQTPAVATQTISALLLHLSSLCSLAQRTYQDFGFGLACLTALSDKHLLRQTQRADYIDPSVFLTSFGATFRDAAAANYFLCLHYALYTRTIPEQRG